MKAGDLVVMASDSRFYIGEVCNAINVVGRVSLVGL